MNVPITVALDVGAPTVCAPEPVAEMQRQNGRLFAAVVAGPLMIWGGAKAGGIGGVALALIGLVSTVRNGRDYYRARAAAATSLTAPPPAVPASP